VRWESQAPNVEYTVGLPNTTQATTVVFAEVFETFLGS